jgi:hypothetical protein
MNLTAEQALALAPDPAAAKAGQGLAETRHWQTLGRNDAALWGLCRGSGKNPYQVRVALPELAAACSCPSRKFPCKHALGLLLLTATQPETVAAGEPPGFVAEWLSKRAGRAEKQPKAEPADPAAAEKRQARRDERLAAGLAELKTWLEDLVGAGFAQAAVREPAFWDGRARRLVDAQAPGLARAVSELAGIAVRGDSWPERLLKALGPIYLAADAFGRAGDLPAPLRADLLRAVGVPQRREDVDEAHPVEDDWLCLGQFSEDLDRVVAGRTWLLGRVTGRRALILNFAPQGTAPEPVAVTGQAETLSLGFFPGGAPLRAVVLSRSGQPATPPAPPAADLAAEFDRHAERLAADPWLSLAPFLVRGRLARDPAGTWWLVDGTGAGLPVQGEEAALWSWLARSGGAPCPWSGEWDGERLRLLHGWPEEGA